MKARFVCWVAVAVSLVLGCGGGRTRGVAGADATAPLDASEDAGGSAVPDSFAETEGPKDAGRPDAGGPDASEAFEASDALEARVDALLGRMTQDEKIGQMMMGGYSSLATTDDVTKYGFGAIGGAPENFSTQDWLGITTTLRQKAAATRLGIPLFIAIDCVHGNGKVRGSTVFPHDIGLGCTHDPALVTEIEAATAAETLAVGFTLGESPDVDVALDDRWGRTYESFGDDPTLVSTMAAAAVRGYSRAGLLPVPKHALGAGGTTWGTGVSGRIDRGNVVADESAMRATHLPPFAAAIQAGAQVVMVSYSAWQGTLMVASHHWLTDVIKGELAFDGVLMTDGNGIDELSGSLGERLTAAINAGIDLVNEQPNYRDVFPALQAQVASGAISGDRVDDAVRRILRVKMRGGLFDAPPPTSDGLSVVGSAAHRKLARQAVRESMVLLKNDGMLLPVSKQARVHVAGKGAADVGIQSGGWTLYWTGVTGAGSAQIGGISILDALRAASSSPANVTYSADGTGASGADVGLVVVHELPYAEYTGDTPDPSFSNTASSNVYDGTAATVVANMKAANIPLVLLLLTGRTVRIESLLPAFGAVVAAWWPGSEGSGVADVLYGDASFTGTLSRAWPRAGAGTTPLFPAGFGLH